MKKILVTFPVTKSQAGQLRQAGEGAELRFRLGEALPSGRGGLLPYEDMLEPPLVAAEDLAWADALLGNIDPELLKNAPNLQWMQTSSAGVEPYVKPGTLPEGAALTNATGAYGLAISEHMLGMLLMVLKKLELYRDAQRDGAWQSQGSVRSVYGATVLVLGMGDIGGDFGRLCKAMGAYVVGVRRTDAQKPDYADEVRLIDELDALLPRADVVAVTLPGTQATRGLLNRERIGRMKPGAVVLNVGRGYIIDTEALCDALEDGRLGGAGLDVTEPEPLPKGHRLWRIPTAVVTPHVSGGYHLFETHQRIVGIFAENMRRFIAGEPLRNLVDFSTGYRRRESK